MLKYTPRTNYKYLSNLLVEWFRELDMVSDPQGSIPVKIVFSTRSHRSDSPIEAD